MALEPALGVLLGLLVLHQKPTIAQIVGIVLVVLAGAGAQRGGLRHRPVTEPSVAVPDTGETSSDSSIALPYPPQ